LADGQGSTRLLIDSTGTATDSTVYTAFGETLFSSGSTPNDFKYVGEQMHDHVTRNHRHPTMEDLIRAIE
jgi:hypothetical protein